ncbi:MAG TPA: cystathionine gamma-lyase [Granulicella sp.]|jgi:cystathionine gamma-lyase|nr:cystathionine gamma-lyase [Granulicella sp.]
MRDATRIIRSTLSPAVAGEPMHHGPVFAAPFHTPGDPSGVAYSYARSHNPTWSALEAAIAEMEAASGSGSGSLVGEGAGFRARALVFGSGMAAVAAVFGAVLRPGDVAVLPTNAYYAARTLIEQYFVPMGITLRMAPTAGLGRAALGGLFEGAKLVWVETPSNPTMEVCDIRAVSAAARRVGALVAADNTTATPLGQSPLALGADFSVASDTKLMTGHSDLLLGHVAVREGAVGRDGKDLYEGLLQWRTQTGSVLGPMEAWLALRSLATLPLRAERSGANALAIARFLKGRAEVLEVLYPGLEEDPGHRVAAGQMRGFGPVLGFVLKDREAAESFLGRSRLITVATSFGGIATTAERRARWGHDAVPEGLIRLSAGCEAIEDLLEDLAQALAGLE